MIYYYYNLSISHMVELNNLLTQQGILFEINIEFLREVVKKTDILIKNEHSSLFMLCYDFLCERDNKYLLYVSLKNAILNLPDVKYIIYDTNFLLDYFAFAFEKELVSQFYYKITTLILCIGILLSFIYFISLSLLKLFILKKNEVI